MKRRLLIVIWGCAVLFTLLTQTFLGDPIRAVSIDSLIWLRDSVPGRVRPVEKPSVAIIAVDEATYRTPPFRGTPRVAWGRYLARVIDALLDAGVTVIGFDIVLPTSLESRLPGVDRELLAVLHDGSREGRIVLGEILHGRERIQPYLGYRAAVGFGENIRPLDVIFDSDGVVRRMPLSLPMRSGDGSRAATASMALELAHRVRSHGDDETGSREREEGTGLAPLASIVVGQGQESIINLHRRNLDLPTYSLADLYRCSAADGAGYFARHFSDKVVLIGSALDVEDQALSSARFIMPTLERQAVDPCTQSRSNEAIAGLNRPTMPGVYLHAAMVQNLLDDDVIWTLPPLAQAALTCLAFGGLMMVGVVFHPIASLSLLGLANAVIVVGASIAFAANLLLFFLVPAAGSIVGYVGGLSLHLLVLERRRRHIRAAFNQLLPSSVVDQLIDRNEFPSGGGRLVACTVLLTDLENYTGLAEQLKPDELVHVLNQVNQVLGEVIERHGGIVSWHAGDSLLALFGAPIECADHAARGVAAALECCSAVDRMNTPDLLTHGVALRIRIGVSTGEVLVGYIGSNRHLTYSAIGDHVNIASRLEGLNKVYGTSVLVNGTTRALASHDFDWREVDETLVKGRRSPISVFEPRHARDEPATLDFRSPATSWAPSSA